MEKMTFVITTAQFDRMLTFYRDLLGLSVIEEWTDFGHGAVLEVLPAAVLEIIEAPDAAVVPTDQRVTFLGVQTGDVDAIHGRLVSAGVRLTGPPTPKPWGGRGFTAFDPDGMPVNLYTSYDRAG
jgi:catechol 2,3-dioxygenase-like lactoylglutathione lyase family enzyme